VLFWAGIPLIALWGLFGAANQTLMTRHVKPVEQGQLQGANASITGISELIGPLIFTLIFAYFVTPGHSIAEAGAPFLMGGLILTAAVVWGVASTVNEREPEG
jgi:DHA1 family tetracycline resistance protein-like MFS transporter